MERVSWGVNEPIAYEPSLNERRFAAANHILSIFMPLLGPLGFLVCSSGSSKFVARHALTAILEQLILKLVLFVGGAISITWTIVKIVQHMNEHGASFTWDMVWPILIKAGITWLILLALGAYLTVKSVFQAIQAYQGKWPHRGLSAKVASKLTQKAG